MIRVKESGNIIFETGFLTLNIVQDTLNMLSSNPSTPFNILDTVQTRISDFVNLKSINF